LLVLTVDMVCLQALVVVWVIFFSFPFVVAASTLSDRLAAARSILGVGKAGLLLPGLFVRVRLEFVRVGAPEVGA